MTTFLNFLCTAKHEKNPMWMHEPHLNRLISAVSARAAAEIYAKDLDLVGKHYHVVITNTTTNKVENFVIREITTFVAEAE